MRKQFQKTGVVWLGILLTLTSCGGGALLATSGGIGGTGITSFGIITAIGSITVNHIEFATTTTEVFADGNESGDESLFRIGQLVMVKGTVNSDGTTGTASIVRIQDNLEGPIASVIESVPGTEKTIKIMGQTVILQNGITIFDAADPAFTFTSLGAGNEGNVVKVSGLARPDGAVEATYIAREATTLDGFLLGGGDLEVAGTIQNLASATSFELNGLLVDITGAVIENLASTPNGVLENGLTVQIEGGNFDANTHTITATEVEVQGRGLGESNLKYAEDEGFVTNLNIMAQTFMVNGQQVDYSGATFEEGLKTDLANGLKVEAAGPVVNGVLVADKIEID